MAGVNTAQGPAAGVRSRGMCYREPGFWGVHRSAVFCTSGLGRHWDVCKTWGVVVTAAWGRRAVKLW